jgi:ParB family chromosome partitioning protein
MSSRLGRGLEALIPTGKDFDDRAPSVTTVVLEKIHPNPYQPRHRFDQEKLEELANSLRESGLIQPIIVTKRVDSNYELIAGERRLEAAKLAGFSEVPVIVRSVTPQEQLQFALIENIQRENLNPIEEAKAYYQLQEEFQLTHNEIAKLVGKNRTTVTNSMRILKLPETVQEYIAENKITSGHARALLQLSDEEQLPFAEKIIKKGSSVRETERQIQNLFERKEQKHLKEQGIVEDAETEQLSRAKESLKKKYQLPIKIKKHNESGSLSFHLRQEKELLELLTKLLTN